jgi:hypothetical protein
MEELQKIIEIFIGEWGWTLIVALLTIAFKDAITKLWNGLLFLYGNDFNVDDIVWINGQKKARIVRQSVYKTTFYLYDHQRKFIIPNDRIWSLHLEKVLPIDKKDQ